MKSKWLYSKHPIVVDMELASEIGLNESIVAQQLNYWINTKSAKLINGKKWIYNTYQNWQRDSFPFWSEATIRRSFTKLEEMGIVETGNFNKAGFDKTKWYTVNTEKLDKLMSRRAAQNEQTDCSKRADGAAQNEQTNTRDYTEITTDNNNNVLDKPKTSNSSDGVHKKIIDYLNSKAGVHYKHNTNATKRVIDARLKEGYTLADFIAVIDKKVAEWISNPEMSKYLRPTTLFGPKFESYLNQKSVNPSQYQKYGAKRVERETDWSKKEANTDIEVDANQLKDFFKKFENPTDFKSR